MNDDLISREALKKALEEEMKFGGDKIYEFDKGYDVGIQKAIEMLDNAPTVDLDERDIDAFETGYIKGLCENRPTGKWLEWEDERWGGVWHYCSNCHNNALCKRVDGTFKQILSDFCPNCGAKMKGGEE